MKKLQFACVKIIHSEDDQNARSSNPYLICHPRTQLSAMELRDGPSNTHQINQKLQANSVQTPSHEAVQGRWLAFYVTWC